MNLDWVHKLPSIKEARKTNKYSQHGEEVVLQMIFDNIGTTNKYLVDYGAGDGFNLSNSRALIEKGWTGLLMDGFHEGNGVVKEFITPYNIIKLYRKHGVPAVFDLLSIDLDSFDFEVLYAQIELYHPRVIIAEFNPYFQHESVYLEYEEGYVWDGTHKYGFSFECIRKWSYRLGYSIIYENGCNVILVQNDTIGGYHDFGITHKAQTVHPFNPNAKWINY